jgi:ribonuclease Y
MLQAKAKAIVSEAEKEAEVIKKDKMLQAKEKFLQLKAEHEKVINERNNKVLQGEIVLNKKKIVYD